MPDPPLDPLVNVVTQLNNNWDVIDLGFQKMQNQPPGPPASPDIGQQYSGADTNAVWTGSTWRTPVSWNDGWSVWTTLSGYFQGLAPFVNDPGSPLQYRNNANIRQVELRGAVRNGAVGNPFDNQTYSLSPMTVGIPTAFTPADGKTFLPAEFTLLTSSNPADFSCSALIIAELRAGAHVGLRIKHNGASNPGSTGNSMFFDNVRWFY